MSNLTLKQNLSTQDLQMVQLEMNKRQKSSAVSWILWLFLGGLGAHRYYLGKTGTAIIMTLTLGCLGIWTLIDLFLLSGMIRGANEKIESEIIGEIVTLKRNQQQAAAASQI